MWHTREIETQNFINVLMKQKRIQNKIIGVYNEEGNQVSSETEVEGVVVNYFIAEPQLKKIVKIAQKIVKIAE